MVSAAAYSDKFDWSGCVGEWITEIAYSAFDPDEIEQLHILLKTLVDLVPELWITCGKGEAALLAVKSLSLVKK